MKRTPDSAVTSEEIVEALNKALSSEEFDGADRLKDFLTYVVQESVEGRGGEILGKRIAQDVYGRSAAQDSMTANVVRVDAGRLRRRLDLYYGKEGKEDAVRIHIDRGGYAPRFAYLESSENEQSLASTKGQEREFSASRVAWIATAVAAAIALVVVIIALLPQRSARDVQAQNYETLDRRAEREVLFEVSPASLQAINLAEEARTMMFPATQPTRLLAALTLFEEAIELDPTYFGGFAGAAQASAMFGGLAPTGDRRDEMLSRARTYAEKAVSLDPASAWSQSSLALVNMFERNFDEANRLSQRAVLLDPTDLISLEIDAIVAFFSGDFDRARTSSSPDQHQERSGSRFPWRSVYGNASFYLGDYETAVEFLLAAAENGEPISEISTAHLIASLYASGSRKKAQKYLDEYVVAWPESRLEELMYRLFQDPANADALISELRELGWRG